MTNKKIAFFKIGALGDVLMTTPLIRKVHKFGRIYCIFNYIYAVSCI